MTDWFTGPGTFARLGELWARMIAAITVWVALMAVYVWAGFPSDYLIILGWLWPLSLLIDRFVPETS